MDRTSGKGGGKSTTSAIEYKKQKHNPYKSAAVLLGITPFSSLTPQAKEGSMGERRVQTKEKM